MLFSLDLARIAGSTDRLNKPYHVLIKSSFSNWASDTLSWVSKLSFLNICTMKIVFIKLGTLELRQSLVDDISSVVQYLVISIAITDIMME